MAFFNFAEFSILRKKRGKIHDVFIFTVKFAELLYLRRFYIRRKMCSLTLSLRNFWHPFSRSVRNYFVDSRKNHGYGYINWYISVTNIARHKICTSLDL